MASDWIKPALQDRGFEGRLFSKPAEEAFVFDIRRLVHAGDCLLRRQDLTKALVFALLTLFVFDFARSTELM